MPRHTATAGLRHDKLSIRAELFMANLFDYNRRQQRASKQVKIFGPGRALLPEVAGSAAKTEALSQGGNEPTTAKTQVAGQTQPAFLTNKANMPKGEAADKRSSGDYKMDAKGNITLVRKTDNGFDRVVFHTKSSKLTPEKYEELMSGGSGVVLNKETKNEKAFIVQKSTNPNNKKFVIVNISVKNAKKLFNLASKVVDNEMAMVVILNDKEEDEAYLFSSGDKAAEEYSAGYMLRSIEKGIEVKYHIHYHPNKDKGARSGGFTTYADPSSVSKADIEARDQYISRYKAKHKKKPNTLFLMKYGNKVINYTEESGNYPIYEW